MIIANLNGRNLFHVKYIRLSYRIRGKVARIHTNSVAKIIVLRINWRLKNNEIDPVNSVADKSLMNKIFIYSAIKIKANSPALYSTLNPETSSDSPSAKSNGVRLVSARLVINHIENSGIIINIIHENIFIMFRSIVFWRISTDSIISDIDTSYEMVCAIPRNAPRRAYFEFEHQPAINVVYTFILDTHRKYNTPYIRNEDGLECGNRIHNIRDRISPRIGANMYGDIFAGVGFLCSLVNSLMASANGWGRPINITLFGPFRNWKYPRNFRSINV